MIMMSESAAAITDHVFRHFPWLMTRLIWHDSLGPNAATAAAAAGNAAAAELQLEVEIVGIESRSLYLNKR
jgi:hypothetical protein